MNSNLAIRSSLDAGALISADLRFIQHFLQTADQAYRELRTLITTANDNGLVLSPPAEWIPTSNN